jgi:hypothetical protein
MEDIYASFSDWTRWADRAELPLDEAGLYVIRARDDAVAGVRSKPRPESRLLYVGETCNQTLRKRLSQFNRSAFMGKPAHSGGTRFNETQTTDINSIQVAVYPILRNEPLSSAFIRYAERAIIWQHVFHHGRAPDCNAK